jgi:hypothetical protein
VQISLDLGLHRSAVQVREESMELPEGQRIDLQELHDEFSDPEDCVVISEKRCRKVYIYSQRTGKYYKLYQPEEDSSPTIVIAGATMHAIVDMTPWEDAEEKVQALRGRGGECLDTCFGLGYSAQLLPERGFESVLTCERDPNVLRVAEFNPWSRAAFRRKDIEIVRRDMREFLSECDPERFAAIFHDPPTIHQAGELYSGELYREFHRVLCRRGWLYHYVGEPGSKTGRDYARGVMRRLQDAGFTRTQRRARGVLCRRRN